MKPRIVRERVRQVQTTTAAVQGSIGRIQIRIESHLSPQARRSIAVVFFRQLRSFLEYFTAAEVHHSDSGSPDFRREELRGICVPAGAGINTHSGAHGFEIRMKRLEMGWSQRELAEKVGISLQHLSKIERGLCNPHMFTRERLAKELGGLPPHFWDRKIEEIELAQRIKIPYEDPDY